VSEALGPAGAGGGAEGGGGGAGCWEPLFLPTPTFRASAGEE